MELAPKAPEERKRRILAAAVEVLTARGFAGTHVADIAEAAGTSPGLVLYHYKSLEGVLSAALTTVEDAFYAQVAGDLEQPLTPTQRLRRVADHAAGTGPGVGDWRLWLELWVRALHDETARATRVALDRRWRGLLRELVDAGVTAGEFHPVDADATTARLASLIDGLAIQVTLDDDDMTPERMSRLWWDAAAMELRLP